MANSLDIDFVEDGRRNAVVKIVGVVDSSDLSYTPAILLSQFSGNEPNMTLNGLKIVEADYSGTPGLLVALDWNSNPPQNIFALSTSAEIRMRRHGGASPNALMNGYDGNINLSTRGFTAGFVYGFTLILRMVKKYS